MGARSRFCSQKFSGWSLWWAAEGWAVPHLSQYVGTMHLGWLLAVNMLCNTVSDTAVALPGTLFLPSINNDTFKWTPTPCRNWLLLVSTSHSSGVGNIHLYHLGSLGRRGETCREHATAVTSQGESWLLGIAACLPSQPYRPDFSGQGVSAIFYPAVSGVCGLEGECDPIQQKYWRYSPHGSEWEEGVIKVNLPPPNIRWVYEYLLFLFQFQKVTSFILVPFQLKPR